MRLYRPWHAAAAIVTLALAIPAIGAAAAPDPPPAGAANTARHTAPLHPVAGPSTPAPAPAASPTPQQTTASYGDWVLRCETVGSGAEAKPACEVVLTMQLRGQQGQQGPGAAIALGRTAKGEPLRLTFVFAPDVYIPAAPRVVIADTPRQTLDLVWQRCIPRRCYADAVVNDATLKQLRERTDPGKIEFKDALQHDVSLPLSFRGLPEALDALAKSPGQ